MDLAANQNCTRTELPSLDTHCTKLSSAKELPSGAKARLGIPPRYGHRLSLGTMAFVCATVMLGACLCGTEIKSPEIRIQPGFCHLLLRPKQVL